MVERYVAVNAFEPTIGFGPDGVAYYLGANLTPSVDGIFEDRLLKPRVLRSTDQGRSWDDVTPGPPSSGLLPPELQDYGNLMLTSFDPHLYVDRETGRIIVYHQRGLAVACDTWFLSSTQGADWTFHHNCAPNRPVFGDHPTLTAGDPWTASPVGYPNVIYFCSADTEEPLGPTGGKTLCRTSLDGGASFGAPVLAYETGCVVPGRKGLGMTGHAASGPDGTVYIGHLSCGAAWILIGSEDGRTWRAVQVDDTVWRGRSPIESSIQHDAAVAVDKIGNVYYFWTSTDSLPYLAISRDSGTSWTAPIPVEAPGVTVAKFPALVAGDEGRIAFLYIGSTVAGGAAADPNAMEDATWNAYIGFSLDALAPTPVFATATANPIEDPLNRGQCYDRCYNDAGYSFGDFLDIELHPTTGAVWVALEDLCIDRCTESTGTHADATNGRGAVGVQIEGSLLAPPT